MSANHIRRSVVLGTIALLVVLTVVWSHQAIARPPVADFAPTYSPREAAARVATAQSAMVAERQALAELHAIDPQFLPQVHTIYFPQTGHHLSNRTGFLDFWRANGQVLIFGYPITEEFIENGQVVQYFERARFEYHAEHAGTPLQVQLGLVGSEYAAIDSSDTAQYRAAAMTNVADPQNGHSYFPETQHTLWGEFRRYWQRYGGLPVFGYPISEEYDEQGRIVQYFERARFEYFPEDMGGFFRGAEQANGIALNTLFEVRLADLGRRLALARGINIAPVPRLAGAPDWDPALWERRIEISLSTQWLTAYEGNLVVYRAPVATGRDGFNTPPGNFAVYDKLTMQTMIGSAGGESWNVPNVPWVMYVVGGVALHGTYWHNAFGTGARMSHGCINLGMDDAQWLYEWADIGVPVTITY